MNIGSSLESAISSLQRNVESAKNVAAQVAVKEDDSNTSSPAVKDNADTVGQMVDVKV